MVALAFGFPLLDLLLLLALLGPGARRRLGLVEREEAARLRALRAEVEVEVLPDLGRLGRRERRVRASAARAAFEPAVAEGPVVPIDDAVRVGGPGERLAQRLQEPPGRARGGPVDGRRGGGAAGAAARDEERVVAAPSRRSSSSSRSGRTATPRPGRPRAASSAATAPTSRRARRCPPSRARRPAATRARTRGRTRGAARAGATPTAPTAT